MTPVPDDDVETFGRLPSARAVLELTAIRVLGVLLAPALMAWSLGVVVVALPGAVWRRLRR